jgi:hypothetical protein
VKISQNAISMCLFTKKADIIQKKLVSILLYTKESILFYPKNHRSQKSVKVQAVLSSAIVSNLALGNDLQEQHAISLRIYRNLFTIEPN